MTILQHCKKHIYIDLDDIWSCFEPIIPDWAIDAQNVTEWALVTLLITTSAWKDSHIGFSCVHKHIHVNEWDHISVILKVDISCVPITFRRVMSSALQSEDRVCLCHLLPPTCATWLWQTLGLRHHLERFNYSQLITNLKKIRTKRSRDMRHIQYILSITTGFAPTVLSVWNQDDNWKKGSIYS